MKNHIIFRLFFSLIIFGIFIICFTSCDNNTVEESYKIEYVLNEGVISNHVTSYNSKTNVTLVEPVRSGYEFIGWYANEKFIGTPITSIKIGTTGDKIFYAKWIEDSHIHIYNYGRCSCGKIDPDGYTLLNYNKLNFDGKGMQYVIKVSNTSEIDPFDENYIGNDKILKQAHQKEIEDAYNIQIVYSPWGKEASWGIDRVNYIKSGFQDKSLFNNNVYAISIDAEWIPTLVKGQCLAELYNYSTEEGIFDQLDYVQDDAINELTAVRNSVYGFDPKIVRPDSFLYYNTDKVKELGLEDPAEMWFKGKWKWSNFDKWVKDAQDKLGDDEYVIDAGYSEFITGAAPAQGNRIVNSYRGVVMFTKSSVTSIIDKMKAYYSGGYWNKAHGTRDVTNEFLVGKTIFSSGKLWFLKDETRFIPNINFSIGVVPYPLDDYTTVIPYTEPYTYEDSESNEFLVDEPLKTRTNEILLTDSGEPIYGVDLSNSNYLIPYTGGSCYSIMNYSNSETGMNSIIAFNILCDLFANTFLDPETVSMTNDDIYRLSLSKKLDYEFDVEVIMSAQQGESYFELIETLSYKVLGDTNNLSKTFWIVLEDIMTSTNTPVEELEKIEDYYKNALQAYN